MILAQNEVLFPCMKWLTRAVERYAPEGFTVWDPRLGGRYVEDFEQWWYSPRPYVAEW